MVVFFFPGKRLLVPRGLWCQDLGMISKMFSLGVNLWRKKLILGSVIRLITQGQVENKGQVTRTDCCAGRANSLFGCLQSAVGVRETTPEYSWMLANVFLFKCKLQPSGPHLAGAFFPTLSPAWRCDPIQSSVGGKLSCWNLSMCVLFLSDKHWQSAGGFEGFCTSSELVFTMSWPQEIATPGRTKRGNEEKVWTPISLWL